MSTKTHPPKSWNHAYLTAPYNAPVGGFVVPLDTIEPNNTEEFNIATNSFTPRRAGIYFLKGHATLTPQTINTVDLLYILQIAPLNILSFDILIVDANLGGSSIQTSTTAYLTPNNVVNLFFTNGDLLPIPFALAGARYGTYLEAIRLD